jgi:hypothetical protein
MQPQDTARPDQNIEPDVISLGADAFTSSRPPRFRLRRLIEVVLLALGLGVVLLASRYVDHFAAAPPRTAPGAARDIAKPSISAASDSPLIVAGTFARPGGWLIVSAHRDPRFCGPAEVRLDGHPTENRRVGEVPTPADPGRLFLWVQIPSTTTAGTHELELFGPLPGGPAHSLCADTPEHQGLLGRAPITVIRR